MECEECNRYIEEDKLDLVNGKWLCHDCEDRLNDEFHNKKEDITGGEADSDN